MANISLQSFASGMIIATSLFTAVYYFQAPVADENKTAEVRSITNLDVQQYLEEQGAISIQKSEYDELINKASQNSAKPPLENQQLTENPPEKQAEGKTIVYILDIVEGMNSIQTADKLEKAGIIVSSQELVQYFNEHKLSRYIQIGTYELNNNMPVEQIAAIITKK